MLHRAPFLFAAACLCITWGAAAHSADIQRTLDPAPPEPAINVSGQVLSPAGEPLAGATVALCAKLGGSQYSFGVKQNRDVLARATTDDDGKFAFTAIGLPPRMAEKIDALRLGAGGAELVAWADGMAVTWKEIKHFQNPDPISLKLAPEANVTGQAVDGAGKPVADACIRLYGITKSNSVEMMFLNEPADLNLNLSELSFEARSDDSGRFTVHHLPAGYKNIVGCTAPGKSFLSLVIDTIAGSDLDQVKLPYGNRDTVPVQHSPLHAVLMPCREVLVKVRDDAGRPVKDGAVQAITAERHFGGWEKVDGDGIARLQLKDSGKYDFVYMSDPLQPRIGARVESSVGLADKPPTVQIQLPAVREITGQVVDAETGAPVTGAYVFYHSTTDDEDQQSPCATSQSVSGKDGRFRLPAIAGPGQIHFGYEVDGYFPPIYQYVRDPNVLKKTGTSVTVPSQGDPEPVTLKLARGLEVRGIVQDAAGKPAVGAVVRGDNNDQPYIQKSTTTDAQGRYVLSGLSPHVKTTLTIADPQGTAERTIEGAADYPWDKTRIEQIDVTLAAGVRLSGRVLKDGKPLAGVTMRLNRLVPEGHDRQRIQPLTDVETNAEGHYAFAGLAPGDGYEFEIIADGLVAPNRRHQSPWMQTVPKDAHGEVHLPDANLVSNRQSLRGVVVDPAGKPVPGIEVSAKIVKGDFAQRPRVGPPPWATTDDRGRFELSQLPDLPIELMAYKSNPKGGPIQHPSKIQPAKNQTDIRILYDPALDSAPEDLDSK